MGPWSVGPSITPLGQQGQTALPLKWSSPREATAARPGGFILGFRSFLLPRIHHSGCFCFQLLTLELNPSLSHAPQLWIPTCSAMSSLKPTPYSDSISVPSATTLPTSWVGQQDLWLALGPSATPSSLLKVQLLLFLSRPSALCPLCITLWAGLLQG